MPDTITPFQSTALLAPTSAISLPAKAAKGDFDALIAGRNPVASPVVAAAAMLTVDPPPLAGLAPEIADPPPADPPSLLPDLARPAARQPRAAAGKTLPPAPPTPRPAPTRAEDAPVEADDVDAAPDRQAEAPAVVGPPILPPSDDQAASTPDEGAAAAARVPTPTGHEPAIATPDTIVAADPTLPVAVPLRHDGRPAPAWAEPNDRPADTPAPLAAPALPITAQHEPAIAVSGRGAGAVAVAIAAPAATTRAILTQHDPVIAALERGADDMAVRASGGAIAQPAPTPTTADVPRTAALPATAPAVVAMGAMPVVGALPPNAPGAVTTVPGTSRSRPSAAPAPDTPRIQRPVAPGAPPPQATDRLLRARPNTAFTEPALPTEPVATAMPGPAAPAAATAPAEVSPAPAQPVDTQAREWRTQMLDRIDRFAAAEPAPGRETHIRLSPDALGEVAVRLRETDRGIEVVLDAAPEARALLAEAAPRLTELAESRGLRLTLQQPGTGEGSGDRPQPQPRQQNDAPIPNRRAAPRSAADTPTDERIA